MRFEFVYHLLKEQLAQEYKQEFISLVTKALKETNSVIYQRMLSKIKEEIEPFVFSSILYHKKAINRDDIQNLYAKLIFSSFSPEVCVAVYNGLIKLSNSPEISLLNTYLHPLIVINEDIAVFKTLSPVILDVKEPNWFMQDDQNDLYEKINLSVQKLSRYLLGQELGIQRFQPLKFAKLAIKYNNNVIQGVEGIFELQAPKELLNLIYDVGLGIYRRKGFGMLELVKPSSF